MSTEENIAVFHQIIEAWSKGNLDILDELVAPDVVRYYHGHGSVTEDGLEEYKRGLVHAHDIYADLQLAIKDIIAKGDTVMARVALEGRHVGQVPGRPAPDNKLWEVQFCSLTRWQDGKVIEERCFWGQWQHV